MDQRGLSRALIANSTPNSVHLLATTPCGCSRDAADAQLKAWRETADKVPGAAAKFAAEKRAGVETVVAKMRSDAAEAEARLQKLRQASGETWAALSAALAQSRKAFDEANQKAWDALKGAGPTKT